MKINLSKKEYKKCQKLLSIKEDNICAAEIYNEYLLNCYNSISFAKDENDFYHQFLKAISCEENNEEIKRIDSTCNIQKIKKLDPLEYSSDSYYQTFKNIDKEIGDSRLTTLFYKPFEGFVYDELIIDESFFSEHTPLGYFEKEFPYPALVKDETIWMSVIPHEINTMKQPICNAFGNVLVMGLGLGYYLFHILEKEEVKSVDVIECDEQVIDLFNTCLIDKFPNKDKIKIIKDNAISYLNNTNRKYDYVFVDIWHNVADGEILYLKLKPFEKKFPKTRFDYWIETSILAMLRRQTLTVFSEYFEGLKEEDYLKARNINDEIINKIYFYHKDTSINSFEDLKEILKDDSLKKMASSLFKQ